MSQSTLEYAYDHRSHALEQLIEWLRIPSISTAAERKPDMQRAAAWLVERMRAIGFDRAEVMPTAGHPAVYGEWRATRADAPTVLIYGHYDVQPTDPDDEWHSPPFEPTVRDGNLTARGAADDKGQLYVHIAAAEAFARTAGAPPVNLKFLVEGEEEIGSANLEAFVRQHADLLACDAALISDTGFLNASTPAIVYAVRGLVYEEIAIQGPRSDLHSGSYGGVAHNPLQVAVELLAALHDKQGRVTIPGFYDRVRPFDEAERAELARVPFDEASLLHDEVGAPALWSGEAGYSALERIGVRPTLELHGIRGGFVGEGQKTVIPARVVCKVSMRLVPNQEPREIHELFVRHIRQLAPPTVQVDVHPLGLADAAVVERDSPAMQAAVQAYRQSFAEPVFLPIGGTLPVVTMLTKILHTPVVMMGLGLPDDNLHAPNEKFKLDHFYRGIDAAIHFMNGLR